jgi:hypothetical protein
VKAASCALATSGAILLMAGALALTPATSRGEEPDAQGEVLRTDLSAVIALTGHACGRVEAVTTQDPRRYLATCGNGKRFLVSVSADDELRVAKWPAAADPPALPTLDHGSHMRRELGAIVRLAGQDCDDVVRFERGPDRRYDIWCRNSSAFWVAMAPDGRIAVKPLR